MNDLDHAATHFTQASHAVGEHSARRHFDAAWRLTTPHVTTILAGELRNHHNTRDAVDDALSLLALKLWVYLRGNETRTVRGRSIGAGFIVTTARNAAKRTLSNATRHTDHTTSLDNLSPTTATFQTTDDNALIEHYAHLAETEYQRPLWAAILRQISEGHAFRVDIARALDANTNTIRQAFHRMRQSPLFADLPSDAPIRRLVQAAHEHFEQLHLFDPGEPDRVRVTARNHIRRIQVATGVKPQPLFDEVPA